MRNPGQTDMNAQTAGTRLRKRGLFVWPFAGVFLLVLLGVLVASIVAASLGAAPWSFYPRPFFFPFGFFFVPLVMFGFFALFWAFAPWRRRHYPGYWHYRDDAQEILRQRYARGEITKDQFEQMRGDLEERK
jgi:uncharacterized membrane protein